MAALAAVKAALQITSPSQVFADQIGSPIAEGIMLGVQAKTLLLADTMHRVSAGAVAGARTESTTYQVNATYPFQAEHSVKDDLIMLTMLKGKR